MELLKVSSSVACGEWGDGEGEMGRWRSKARGEKGERRNQKSEIRYQKSEIRKIFKNKKICTTVS